MSNVIAWIAAEAEPPRAEDLLKRRAVGKLAESRVSPGELPVHQFPARPAAPEGTSDVPGVEESLQFSPRAEEVGSSSEADEDDRERRTYRGRTIAMLRRYMRYSIETGRLPSLLGKEFFRAKVTAYTAASFEDRVIFVHDMETCLQRLDEFSQQLLARHILQEHDRWATARLLHCNEKTVRRCTPMALDLLSEILLEVGLMERLEPGSGKSCQEGKSDPIPPSDCEDGGNKL